ncbi:MAG: hypothetical protein EXR77_17525 [Myxococcales bacterium]|nr:hypothetical protein [Myxococcales bacterium]
MWDRAADGLKFLPAPRLYTDLIADLLADIVKRATRQAEQGPRVDGVVLAVFGAAVDQNATRVHAEALDARAVEPAGEPEAVAAGFVHRVNLRVARQAEVFAGLVDFDEQVALALFDVGAQDLALAAGLAAIAAGELSGVLAHVESDVQGADAGGRIDGGGGLCRLRRRTWPVMTVSLVMNRCGAAGPHARAPLKA